VVLKFRRFKKIEKYSSEKKQLKAIIFQFQLKSKDEFEFDRQELFRIEFTPTPKQDKT
jgi:hypothetical protein